MWIPQLTGDLLDDDPDPSETRRYDGEEEDGEASASIGREQAGAPPQDHDTQGDRREPKRLVGGRERPPEERGQSSREPPVEVEEHCRVRLRGQVVVDKDSRTRLAHPGEILCRVVDVVDHPGEPPAGWGRDIAVGVDR